MKGTKECILRLVYLMSYKDIGTMYIVYGAIAGIVGTMFSIVIRMELAYPSIQLIVDLIIRKVNNLVVSMGMYLFVLVLNFFYKIEGLIFTLARSKESLMEKKGREI
jgi:heme/copper-type cytochrome/quinol oxidase subunit 1